MKTIFVATDFSLAAHNACLYAASLANKFNARLVLFSAYESIQYPSTEVPLVITVEDVKAGARLALAQAEEAVRLKHSHIEVETICSEGAAVNEIMSAARKTGAGVIVTGMKEKGRGFRKIFGSTVTALIRKSHLPVIVVPESAAFVDPDTIALANDRDTDAETDTHLVDILLELGRQFSSKLYVVRITKNSFQQSFEVFNRPLRLLKMLQPLQPVYECFESANEERALSEFVWKYSVNMLVLLPHYHSAADRLFAKSTTRAMVFRCRIPLLILPGLRMQEHG